jgi:hypothetical protein
LLQPIHHVLAVLHCPFELLFGGCCGCGQTYGCQPYGASGYCDPCGAYPALYSQNMGGPCCHDGGYSGGGYYPSAAPTMSAPGGPVVPPPADAGDPMGYLSPHISAF